MLLKFFIDHILARKRAQLSGHNLSFSSILDINGRFEMGQ